MNNPRQYEILSAYLDGELNAAEQAEAERLLAADPAARKLLEELRALSASLRSLPRREVGEDLSRHVLRVAERRILIGEETDQEPGWTDERKSAPLPGDESARSFLRRFVTRRNLVWLGLTAAVALMITFNEHQQHLRRPAESGRELALATPKTAHQSSVRSGAEYEPPVLRAAPMEEQAAKAAGLPAKGVDAPVLSKDMPAAALPVETPAFQPSSAASAPSAAERVLGIAAEKTIEKKEKSERDEKFPADSRRFVKELGNAAVFDNLWIVRCDIKPETVKTQMFDKLLAANGIEWQENGLSDDDISPKGAKGDSAKGIEGKDGLVPRQGGRARQAQTHSPDASVPPMQSVANRLRAWGESMQRPPPGKAVAAVKPSDEALARSRKAPEETVDYVYVAATPSQIAATLAGLSARPDAFLSVSVEPKHDEETLNKIIPEIIQQQVRVGQFQSNQSLSGRMGEVKSPEQPQSSNSQIANEKREQFAYAMRKSAEQQGPPELQRVMFVLRVVDDGSAAKAVPDQLPAERKSEPAKPDESSSSSEKPSASPP